MATFYPYRTRRKFKGSEGVNVDSTWNVKCEAIGKCRCETSPYLIANEWICGNLAQLLRLPIPPFSLIRKRTQQTLMFASYSFEGDTAPKDANPGELYAKYPELCAGIVVFDILIANCDRGTWNIKVDNPKSPSVFYIFDHEHALFYVYPKEGINRLNSRSDRLGISGSHESGMLIIVWWDCSSRSIISSRGLRELATFQIGSSTRSAKTFGRSQSQEPSAPQSEIFSNDDAMASAS